MSLIIPRRTFLRGLFSTLVAAPMIVRPTSIMPVKPYLVRPTRLLVRGWDAYGDRIEYEFDLTEYEGNFFRERVERQALPYYQHLLEAGNSVLKVWVNEDA